MQPYFLPYVGYWQLMASVDMFVVYDNIEYTKKGWINRNRFLLNGKDEVFSIPLKKGSDFLYVNQRRVGDCFLQDKEKLLRRWQAAYRKAPYFESVFPIMEEILGSEERNLFEFIFNSLQIIRHVLGIKSRLIISSQVDVDHALKGQDKVLALCEALNATEYVNPIGGLDLYGRAAFAERGVALYFQKARSIEYSQMGNSFVPNLSILDVLMFCGQERARQLLAETDLC